MGSIRGMFAACMRPALLGSVFWLLACQGTITTPAPIGPGGEVCVLAAPATKLVRLTHTQYDNTVNDLLGLFETPSASFTADPSFSGFNNNAEGMVVADRLGRDYRRAAEDLATKVITTPASRAAVLPCTANTDACKQQFISVFGRRAFRRPLTTTEEAAYFALFQQGPALVDGTDAFSAGVSITVEAMLQSPNFLYRTEVDLEAGPDGLSRLTPYEVASRLSYLLWDTLPDQQLLDAADRGALSTPEEVRAQAERLLSDARANRAVDDFHAQWLELERYRTIVRDPALFPNFNASMPPMMQEETQRFVRSIVLEDRAPFSALYTANYTFVNAELARLYGMSGSFGAGFTRVTLDPAQRKGLLTQPGLLASHSYSRTDSPIHRGVFVVRRVLGILQADPPPGIDFTLPPMSGTIRTTRDQVTLKTSARDCAGCHNTINGPGFAFGHYDAVGQWRTQENSVDVDTTGTLNLTDGPHAFTDALTMIDVIAASQEARRSYARNWFRYASQRATAPGDSCELETLATGLASSERPARELLIDLALLPSFTLRPAESP